jgi:hypothetical protein
MRGPIKKSQWAWGVLLVVSVAGGCAALERPGTGESTDNPTTAPRGILQTTPAKVDSVSTNGIWQNGFSTNGIWQNGIWQNGIWQNGIWQNGIWQNGIWQNGIWQNGIWQNGIWQNGIWQNGLGTNGIWQNGIWQNGIWQNGIWQNGLPSTTLQKSQYARQLLQYIYGCAMPAPVCPAGGGQPISDYDSQIDPNSPSIACTPSSTPCDVCPAPGADAGGCGLSQGSCDPGYVCTPTYADAGPANTCVVPLRGAIGVGINADGSTWWGQPAPAGSTPDGGPGSAGSCDESCQRWVSACVLARTNAYGVHVNISMRAPANAPQAIKDALKVTDVERNGSDAGDAGAAAYSLREGAFYGNIFETTPTPMVCSGPSNSCATPSAPSGTCYTQCVPASAPLSADGGPYTGPAAAPVAETPSFYACAGPGSNIPEFTGRFCSSQGDQVVIAVPGVCLTDDAGEQGTCAAEDTDASSPTFGAIQHCYTTSPCAGSSDPTCFTTSAATSTSPCAGPSDPTCFDQVITVYLQEPIAVCGNALCETGEDDPCNPNYCPTDCHPGTWAKNISPNIGQGIVGNDLPGGLESVGTGLPGLPGPGGPAISAVGPGNTVVVAGTSQSDVNLSGADGGALSAGAGVGVLAMYNADGSYAWSTRFGNTSPSAPGGQLQEVDGVAVAPNGNVVVAGTSLEDITDDAGNASQSVAIWISSYTPDGVLVGSWSLPVDPTGKLMMSQPTRGLAVDQAGDILLTRSFFGTIVLGANSFTSTTPTGSGGGTSTSNSDTFLAKVAMPGPDAATSSPTVVWAVDFKSGVIGLGGRSFPLSLAVDTTGNIVEVVAFDENNDRPNLDTVIYKVGPDGSSVWNKDFGSANTGGSTYFSTASFDKDGNVYASGYIGEQTDFGGDAAGPTNVTGVPPFIVKYDSAGNFQWVNSASIQCPPGVPSCVPSKVQGVGVGFDTSGNAVLASFGDPGVGGFINFAGIIPTGDGGARVFYPFPTYAKPNIFLAAYSPDVGQLVWAEQIPTILNSSLMGFALDSQGRIVVSGNYSGSMTVDDRPLVTSQSQSQNVVNSYVASFGGPPPATTGPAIGAGSSNGAPIITVPANTIAQATSAAGAFVFYNLPTASAAPGSVETNACGVPIDAGAPSSPSVRVECQPPPNSLFLLQPEPTLVTCTAFDALGNSSSTTFTVTVVDQVGPVFSPVSDVQVQATSASGAVVNYTPPTASDQVTGDVPSTAIQCAPAPGSTFPVGTKTVVCTAPDGETPANVSQTSFVVTVTPQPGTICTPTTCAAQGANCGTIPDGCGGTPLSCGSCTLPQKCGGGGTANVCGCKLTTCAAQGATCGTIPDGCGGTLDCGPCPLPTLTLPAPITATATSSGGATVSYSATATDPLDGPITPVCKPASGSTFALGPTSVSCTATNSHGGQTSGSFQVQVQYAWSGFLQPINADGSSVFKLGSTVPVQFQLTGVSAGITNATATLTVAKISSNIVGTDMEAVSTSAATTGNAFRYDSTSGQYIFNLATKGLSKGSWQLSVNLQDGVSRTVTISLR